MHKHTKISDVINGNTYIYKTWSYFDVAKDICRHDDVITLHTIRRENLHNHSLFLHSDSWLAHLDDPQDTSQQAEEGSDYWDSEWPVESFSLLRTINTKANNHEDHCKEAEDDETEDCGVLADSVNTEVDAGQDDAQEQTNQTNANQGLHSLHPAFALVIMCGLFLVGLPESLVQGLIDGPGRRGKADDVENGGQRQTYKYAASETAERYCMDSYTRCGGPDSGGGRDRHDDSKYPVQIV